MKAGDRIIKRHAKDRAIYFIIQGSAFGLDDGYPVERTIYSTGDVIGINQFLHDEKWEQDIFCKEDQSVIGRITYSQFQDLKSQQPQSAIKFYNRIIRKRCLDLVDEKKKNGTYMIEGMES